MSTQTVTLKVSDGTSMNAYVSTPEGKGPFPGMLVLQEAFGVNGHIRNVADRIAKEGYVAIAPELFHRSAKPGEEFAYNDFAPIMPHFQAMSVEGMSADVKACYDWLQQQANVKHGKIGSIGFCLGGRVSFLANATVPLSAAVSFYGGRTESIADKAIDLHGPQLFFWGGLDKHILQEHIDAVINAVKKANKPYTNVVISYADHAFHCDERPSYNKQAASEAWAMSMAFLKNNLGN
ncbi:MAG TPA: dienelactone hydrolase family protein [Bacteroidia bacterium]|nr:dienelactone hydrolase family protein [Bacteroidia bacterium]